MSRIFGVWQYEEKKSSWITVPSLLFVLLLSIQLYGVVGNKEIPENPNVVELNTTNFFSLTQHGQWMIKFYEDWCGICQRAAPQWNGAAAEVSRQFDKMPIRFGRVRCGTSPEVCMYYGITGYPTFKYIHGDVERRWDHDPVKSNFVAFAEQITKEIPQIVENLEEWNILWEQRRRRLLNKPRMTFLYTGPSDSPSRIAFDIAARDWSDVADFFASDAEDIKEKFPWKVQALSHYVEKPLMSYRVDPLQSEIRSFIQENRYYWGEYVGESEREHEFYVSEKRVVLVITPADLSHLSELVERYAAAKTTYRFIRLNAMNLGTINWLNSLRVRPQNAPQLVFWDVLDDLKYYSSTPANKELTAEFISDFLLKVEKGEIEPVGTPPGFDARAEEAMFFLSRRFYPFAYFLGLCLRYPTGIVISFGLFAFLVIVVTIAFICVENREERRLDQDKARKEKGTGDVGGNKTKQTKAE